MVGGKKKLLVLLCFLFVLGGCTKGGEKDLVLRSYETWKNMNMNIWVIGLEKAGNENYTLDDGTVYYQVSDIDIQSINDIKSAVEEVCTEKGAEELFYEPYLKTHAIYLEKEGTLYRKMAEIPANYGGELIQCRITKKEKEYIQAELEYFEDLVEKKYIINIAIACQDGKWLVDSLEQVWE